MRCLLQVAIKYIDRRGLQGFHKYVLRETLNHQQLSLCKHPHIVEFYEVGCVPCSVVGHVHEPASLSRPLVCSWLGWASPL